VLPFANISIIADVAVNVQHSLYVTAKVELDVGKLLVRLNTHSTAHNRSEEAKGMSFPIPP
jgi:hypothetical protein